MYTNNKVCNSSNTIAEYIAKLKEISKNKKTEHADRTNLENLLNNLKPSPDILIQHEPKLSKEGLVAPNYIVKVN